MIRIQARGPSEADILIHQEIGENWFGDGLTSKKFADDLQALGDVRTINVDINSPGGAVYDGVAIYNTLKNHGARINVRVSGIAASIASVIAMAGDAIEMGVGAMMMVHQPWSIAIGNADDMREFADVLDKHRDALVDIYAKRTGQKRAEIERLLRAETWMTGAEAVEHGFADSVAQAEEQPDETAARALIDTHKAETERFMNTFRENMSRLTPMQIAAAVKLASGAAGAGAPAEPKEPKEPKEPAAPTESKEQIEAAATAKALAAEQTRRTDIRAAFGRYVDEHRALLDTCLDDPKCTVDGARKKLLDKLGEAHADPINPTNPNPSGSGVRPGADEADKRREAVTMSILARIGQKVKDKDGVKDVLPVVDNSNPYRGFSLFDIAEESVRRARIDLRGMNRSQIVAAAFGHTTSDFPNLLENVMHKLVVVAYQGANTTWDRVARIGDLTDFRAHPRYRYGTFSDIKTVNEAGRYEQGTISDAEKESITAKRKGRILVVTRELIVNDDLQAISDMARGLGRAANRTIDKDLYALLALNTNTGPTMGDGTVLFHANHKNIAGTAAAPTVVSLDAARVQMAKQVDPSGNDFVDIRPAIAWCPLELGSTIKVLNESQYDPDANNKLQRPNSVRGIVRDVVDSPRLSALSAQVWYVLADPNEEPVFEVGFLGGAREPRVEQEQEFSSDSLQWKVVHEYGVAAIGWRGIVKNAGA